MPQAGEDAGEIAEREEATTMIRLIKRYESRKLYDTEESRYVSLDDIASWVREGQEVKVVDNATSADVTAQTLTQIILDDGRRGTSLPSELLHDLVRRGEKTFASSVEHVQQGMDRLMRASIDRLGPVRRVRQEMDQLRSQLEGLEATLSDLEVQAVEPDAEPKTAPKKKAAPRRKAAPRAKKPASTKKPAAKTAAAKTAAAKTAAAKKS